MQRTKSQPAKHVNKNKIVRRSFLALLEKLATVLDVQSLPLVELNSEKLFGELTDCLVDVSAIDHHVRKVVVEHQRNTTACESSHVDAFRIRLPQQRQHHRLVVRRWREIEWIGELQG